jgi:hypothetical protein
MASVTLASSPGVVYVDHPSSMTCFPGLRRTQALCSAMYSTTHCGSSGEAASGPDEGASPDGTGSAPDEGVAIGSLEGTAAVPASVGEEADPGSSDESEVPGITDEAATGPACHLGAVYNTII